MRRALALLVAVVAGLVLLPGPSAHALTRSWAAWTPVTGSSNNYTTTMQQQSTGFPRATVATDSRSNVQLPAGSSTFLSAATPPGAKYGSSQGSSYVVLRPRADTPTGASTTTYTFDHPTPDTGWTFVLGDVDADAVQVRATGEDGTALPAGEIATWFKETFNYAGGADLPAWNPLTSTLTGNAGALDTDGAAAWFEPDVRLTSLTFAFTRRAGFPVYQTWFASFARPIAGQVVDDSEPGDSCPITDAVLTLFSPYGEVLGETSPQSNGSYTFGELATQGGYTVRVTAPPTCAVVGSSEDTTVSNAGNDGDESSLSEFTLREIVPQPISGTVHAETDDGPGVPGVEVTVDRPVGPDATTTTDADGAYLFDENDLGDDYGVSIAVPDGYDAGPDGTEIDGIDVAATPVTGQDFVVLEQPAVTGTVTGGGGPLGGVTVTLTPDGGGPPRTTSTAGNGTYSFDAVPAGGYTVTVVPPPGYGGDDAEPVTVAGADETVDFELTRPGALGGTVSDGNGPVAGVDVVVDGSGAPTTVTTDEEGRFFVDGLTAGVYDVAPEAPDGTEVEAPATRTTTITAAGEVRGGLDFVLDEVAGPGPTETPTTEPTEPIEPTASPTDQPTGPGGGAETVSGSGGSTLPDTGGPPVGWLVLGVGLVVGGVTLLVVGRRRERA